MESALARGMFYVGVDAVVLAPGESANIGAVLETDRRVFATHLAGAEAWPAALPLRWNVSDPSIAAVDTTGAVTALTPGRAYVRVTAGDQTDSAAVVVRPVGTAISTDFVELQAGSAFSCGRTVASRILCWVGNGHGELGTGATHRLQHVLAPVPTRAPTGASALAVGASHACALDGDKQAHCWGSNFFGELGDGSTVSRGVPRSVSGGLAFVHIDAGAFMTCALTAAGDAYCWGDWTAGVSAVPRLLPGGLRFATISVGGNHACALTGLGTAYCWGANEHGQLGASGVGRTSATPVPVAGSIRFRTVSAGTLHSCGVADDGTVYCWGSNIDGRLGIGERAGGAVPVALNTSVRFIQVSAGGTHTCGVAVNGAAYCWGSNWRGQLGNALPFGDPSYTGQDYRSFVPVPVAMHVGPVAGVGDGFSSISAGTGDLTCALTSTNTAACWGGNLSGALGEGRQVLYSGTELPVRTAPVLVAAPVDR